MTPSPSSGEPRKVVLITGASSGIGKACAEHLAAKGYRVFGAQRHVPEGKPQAEGVESITMDVEDDDSVDHALQVLFEKAGRLDAVVNNAGFALMGSIEDTTVEEARAQMETNFFGVLRVCRVALPIMRKQGEATDQTRLIFDRVGDQYFLSEIFEEGNSVGVELHKPRAERELKKEGAITQLHSVAVPAHTVSMRGGSV